MRRGGHEKSSWATTVQGLYLDEDRERDKEREFLESLRSVIFTSAGFSPFTMARCVQEP